MLTSHFNSLKNLNDDSQPFHCKRPLHHETSSYIGYQSQSARFSSYVCAPYTCLCISYQSTDIVWVEMNIYYNFQWIPGNYSEFYVVLPRVRSQDGQTRGSLYFIFAISIEIQLTVGPLTPRDYLHSYHWFKQMFSSFTPQKFSRTNFPSRNRKLHFCPLVTSVVCSRCSPAPYPGLSSGRALAGSSDASPLWSDLCTRPARLSSAASPGLRAIHSSSPSSPASCPTWMFGCSLEKWFIVKHFQQYLEKL